LKCSGLTNHQDPLQLTHIMNEPDTIKNILKLKIIAVVGMSPKPERPSHYVSMYMKEHGYTIIPVNPFL